MFTLSRLRLFLIGPASLLLVSCVSTPWGGGGDRFSDEIAELEDRYEDGSETVERGLDMISDGKKKLAKNERRRDRELREAENRRMKADALRREIAEGASGTTGSKELRDLARRLRSLQNDIRENEEEAEDALEDIREARDEIARGEQLVVDGTRVMRAAERQYQLETGRTLSEEVS